jgi:hypothetical protein
MNVFINTAVVNTWQVVVDNVHDILDIQPTSRNTSCNQDRCLARTEGDPKIFEMNDVQWYANEGGHLHNNLHGIFAFTLGTTAMDGSTGKAHVVQIIVNQVSLCLGIDEYQGAGRRH